MHAKLKLLKVPACKPLKSALQSLSLINLIANSAPPSASEPNSDKTCCVRFRVVVGHAARSLTHSPRSLAEPHGQAMLVVPHLLSPAVRMPHLVRARPAAAMRTSVAAMVDEPEPQAGWRLPFDPFDWSALWGGDEADAEPKLVG